MLPEPTLLEIVLNYFVYFGGAMFVGMCATASFYAVFYFFWTRTGARKQLNIDWPTKAVYLMPIYWTMRIALGLVILTRLAEMYLLQIGVEDFPWGELLLSSNRTFLYLVLVVLAINSLMMYKRWINYAIGIPIAVTSWFTLFFYSRLLDVVPMEYILVPETNDIMLSIGIYGLIAVVVGIVFNFFSAKVRKATES